MKVETQVKRLIRETYDCFTPKGGNCIYQAKCPFLHSVCYRDKEVKFESKRCDYFETHVLPADKELYALYFREGQEGRCARCVTVILSPKASGINIVRDIVMEYVRDK